MAHHVAEEYEVEQLEDVWRLTTEDLAAVVAVLTLRPVSADKLKEAVKAAQVLTSFGVHVVYPVFILLKSSRVSGQAHAASPARQQTSTEQ